MRAGEGGRVHTKYRGPQKQTSHIPTKLDIDTGR